MKIVHDDGNEAEIGPGNVARSSPGTTPGSSVTSPFTSIDFGGYGQYGLPKS